MSGTANGLKSAVPWAVVTALAVQTGGALVWAGKAQARLEALEARGETQGPVAERLARVETQVEAAAESLRRIERRLEVRP